MPNLTLALNALSENLKETTIPVDGVVDKNGKESNYLLTIESSKHKLKLKVEDKPILEIFLKLYCKISDHDIEGSSESLSQNMPLPKEVKDKTEQLLTSDITRLVQTSISTDCDFLGLKEKLYRFNHKQYSLYKDNLLSKMGVKISVIVDGQK